jgi:hypothetical protein
MSFARLFVLGGLLVFAAPDIALAQETKPPASYTDAEAAQHAGEEATVTGKVVAVTKSAKGTTYLNFGDRFPKHVFSGVVFVGDQEKAGDMKPYEGKVVAITGRIELAPSDQKPQIAIKKPEQIKLAEPGAPPAPALPPAPAPSASATPAPMKLPPLPPVAPLPATLPPPVEAKKIVLSTKWNSPVNRGEMTRKDLAMLFGAAGSASESTAVNPSVMVYPDIPMLTPLTEAKKALRLENVAVTTSKVTCAGLPADSFSSHAFTGVFPGGYSRLHLITDLADQVVSVLLVDENSRQRATGLTDSFGYHTYNFISGRVKGNNELLVKHEIATTGAPPGVLLVDSLLIDTNDPEAAPQSRSKTSTQSKRKPTTGRVMERSRWFVPQPVVNLILRCVGSR